MYTWGYLKENALSKLNLSEEEANEQHFLSRFPYYANEAMTQICSAIKPKEVFLEVTVYDKKDAWIKLTKEFSLYEEWPMYKREELDPQDEDYDKKKAFWDKWDSLYFTETPITFPKDFISFSNDDTLLKEPPIYIGGLKVNTPEYLPVGDEVVKYYGYNQVICKKIGEYKIPYNARWFFFTKELDNDVEITAPADICEAIPSYIVSQCLKIDDEQKAAIYRNEYEMFLARIDDTSFRAQRNINISGGW